MDFCRLLIPFFTNDPLQTIDFRASAKKSNFDSAVKIQPGYVITTPHSSATCCGSKVFSMVAVLPFLTYIYARTPHGKNLATELTPAMPDETLKFSNDGVGLNGDQYAISC